ncbi:hypothetical protein PR048_002068 [Dryococelus australis]|uniref:Uncharacterized protein n=1 Tax=Dryococelus australis TaxID=614101 RepID=A0ABQ9ILQ7_9NEOP|nr:hypothetical protein PR048_002068 [Dryococelus australis]
MTLWQRQHQGSKIPKKDRAENISTGFRKGGIIPFNNYVVDASKYDPQALRRFKDATKNPPILMRAQLFHQEMKRSSD